MDEGPSAYTERDSLLSDIERLKQALADETDSEEDEIEENAPDDAEESTNELFEGDSASDLLSYLLSNEDLYAFTVTESDVNCLLDEIRRHTADQLQELEGLRLNEIEAPSEAKQPPSEAKQPPSLREVVKQPQPPFRDRERGRIVEILRLNREYQAVLEEKICEIDTGLRRIEANRASLEESASKGKSDKVGIKCLTLKRFLGPYFADARGLPPPDNGDTKLRKACLLAEKPRNWSDQNKAALYRAVKMQTLEAKCTSHMSRLNALLSQAEDVSSEREEIEAQLEEIKKLPDDVLLKDFSMIDWYQVEIEVMEHGASSCRARWIMVDHPRINKTQWTEEESAELVDLVKKHGDRNWCLIAESLKTNRTPVSCLQRYLRVADPLFQSRVWTDDEDARLIEAISLYGNSRWIDIADYVGDRLAAQCQSRWESVNPRLKKGRWTMKEDQTILKYVRRLGLKWASVAKFLPGRSGRQVRERYVHRLDPKLSHKHWRRVEDSRLMKIVAEVGRDNWAEVAQRMANRTKRSCFNRWARLSTFEEVEDYFYKKFMNQSKRGSLFRSKDGVTESDIRADAARRARRHTSSQPFRPNRRDNDEEEEEEEDMSNDLDESEEEETTNHLASAAHVWEKKRDPLYLPKRKRPRKTRRTFKRRKPKFDKALFKKDEDEEDEDDDDDSEEEEEEEEEKNVDGDDDEDSFLYHYGPQYDAVLDDTPGDSRGGKAAAVVSESSPLFAPLSLLLRIFRVDVNGALETIRQRAAAAAEGREVSAEEASSSHPDPSFQLDVPLLPASWCTIIGLRCLFMSRRRLISSAKSLLKSENEEAHRFRLTDELKNSHDYQLLRNRFRSLFFWPTIMTGLAPQTATK